MKILKFVLSFSEIVAEIRKPWTTMLLKQVEWKNIN